MNYDKYILMKIKRQRVSMKLHLSWLLKRDNLLFWLIANLKIYIKTKENVSVMKLSMNLGTRAWLTRSLRSLVQYMLYVEQCIFIMKNCVKL